MKNIFIGKRGIGPSYPPFVIAEIGINHEGSFKKALLLADAAAKAGADCVKFQSHITEKEMVPNNVVPGNTKERIWDIIKRCELSPEEEKKLKHHCDKKGILFLSTPFSREAADNLRSLGVPAFKIGSGECNNYPLIEHIARFKKPIILSTGMNDINSVRESVRIIKKHSCPLALMHCTSMYPTPYEKVRLNAITDLMKAFNVPAGLSDHSPGIYTCIGAVALGASLLEKHFTVSKKWPGPDIEISITPQELKELKEGSSAVYLARGGSKTILKEERPVINFAYASVVSTLPLKKGEKFTNGNIWVKRPGTGEIKARDYKKIIGKTAARDIKPDTLLKWKDIR